MLNPRMGLSLVCLMLSILTESEKEKKNGNFTLFVECKVFFESEGWIQGVLYMSVDENYCYFEPGFECHVTWPSTK